MKEDLFNIFESDILTYRQRELATVATLASMLGVEGMLQANINMGMNVGVTKPELIDLFTVIETTISKEQAAASRIVLTKVLATR